MVPARTWRVHAVGVAPTEKLKLKRQMAVAAGKKSTTSVLGRSRVVQMWRQVRGPAGAVDVRDLQIWVSSSRIGTP